jgi:hypothetical protein
MILGSCSVSEKIICLTGPLSWTFTAINTARLLLQAF